MGFVYDVECLHRDDAYSFIRKYHYSNTLPKLNKYFLGFYFHSELVGVVTLGWGTRPLHTIQTIFPSLYASDYLEIGRMCMSDKMPRNSESQMISCLIHWIKENCANVKVLFTWADGMLGKVGYVYQSCSFYYAGYSYTDVYLIDGVKIYPRQMCLLLSPNDSRITVRPNCEQMKLYNIEHYRGKQYKYLSFLCNKYEKKRLLKESLYELNNNYPKESDLKWSRFNFETNNWEESSMPLYKSDVSADDIIFNKNKFFNNIDIEWNIGSFF